MTTATTSYSNENVTEKLTKFIIENNIPNILFYGNHGCGKKTILNNFLLDIYQNKTILHKYVLFVDCEFGKGIKFIREELKFFAKTKLCNNKLFKSIILINADKLTVDAQSALRRCIEIYSENNRFFIIVENIDKLQKPILSRCCHIYIPSPKHKKHYLNLHSLDIQKTITNNIPLNKIKLHRDKYLKSKMNEIKNDESINFITLAEDLYERAYCAYDIYYLVKNDNKYKFEDEIIYSQIHKNIKNEVLMIASYLFFLFRNKDEIEISDFIKYG